MDPKVQPVATRELQWTWPPEQDGWTKSHDAIRLDMEDFQRAITALLRDTKPGERLPRWKCDAFSNFFQRMHHFIIVPKKMSAQHIDLVKAIDLVKNMVGRLSTEPDAVPMLQKIKEVFDAMAVEMREHLKEEEEIGLPLLRTNFTSFEMEKNVNKKIVAASSLDDFAQILRPMDNTAKHRFMKDVCAIPRPVQALLMMPRTRKYNKTYILPLRDLIDNEQGKHAPASFDCFGLIG